MRFQNPANGYVETVWDPGVPTFLFGTLYFAYKGVWHHVGLSLILAVVTLATSWFVYPFFAAGIIRSHYQRQGWVLLEEPEDDRDQLDLFVERCFAKLFRREQSAAPSEDARIERYVMKTAPAEPDASPAPSGGFGRRRPT